jgi:hypothetical protein
MSWLNEVTDLLQQYKGAPGSAPPPNASADFAKVAQRAPAPVMSSGLAEAFRSNSTPAFSEMISHLFGQSDGAQRAGILNHLISTTGPGALPGSALENLKGSSSGSRPTITPEQAQQVHPEAVRQLAEQAQKSDPSIIDRASDFYSQHPTLIKSLGATALAVIMSHMSRRH